MGLFLQHKSLKAHLAIWKIEESMDELFDVLPQKQKAYYKQEIISFTSDRRKLEWLAVRALLYTMLQEDKIILYSSDDKPYFADHSYAISISHTKGYAAVILSDTNIAGIDVERYGDRIQRLSERFMRKDEHAEPYLNDTTWSILLHWSAKETIFKSMEKADPDLRKLRVLPFCIEEEGIFQVREYVTEQQRIFTIHYRICPDFVLTWAID